MAEGSASGSGMLAPLDARAGTDASASSGAGSSSRRSGALHPLAESLGCSSDDAEEGHALALGSASASSSGAQESGLAQLLAHAEALWPWPSSAAQAQGIAGEGLGSGEDEAEGSNSRRREKSRAAPLAEDSGASSSAQSKRRRPRECAQRQHATRPDEQHALPDRHAQQVFDASAPAPAPLADALHPPAPPPPAPPAAAAPSPSQQLPHVPAAVPAPAPAHAPAPGLRAPQQHQHLQHDGAPPPPAPTHVALLRPPPQKQTQKQAQQKQQAQGHGLAQPLRLAPLQSSAGGSEDAQRPAPAPVYAGRDDWLPLSERVVPYPEGYAHAPAQGPGSLQRRQFKPDDAGPADFTLSVSPPVNCQYVNITFDPSRGTGPYNLVIAFSNFFPFQLQIPTDYAPMGQGLWQYRFLLPDFGSATPDMIAALTDSHNIMSNSSNVQTVVAAAPKLNCPSPFVPADFIFYPTGVPQQCENYLVTWNGSWVPPMTMFLLPENQPPISIALPDEPIFKKQGYGAYNITLPLRAGTSFFFTMTDGGPHVTGGVSQRNVVGLDENFVNSACLQNAYNSTSGIDDQVPRPTSTVAPAGSSGLPASYVTVSLETITTGKSGSLSTITTVATQTIVAGTPLPGWQRNTLSPASHGLPTSILGTIISVVIVAVVAAVVASVVWCLCSKRAARRRRTGVTKWDVPSNKPADPLAPIQRGIFSGQRDYRGSFATLHSTHTNGSDGGAGGAAHTPQQRDGQSIDLGSGAMVLADDGSYPPRPRHGSGETELQNLSSNSTPRLGRGTSRSTGPTPLSMESSDGVDSWGQWLNASSAGGSAPHGGSAAAYAGFEDGVFSSSHSASASQSSRRTGGKPGERAGPGPTYRSPYGYVPTGVGSPTGPNSPSIGSYGGANGSTGMYPTVSQSGFSSSARSPLLSQEQGGSGFARSEGGTLGHGGASSSGTGTMNTRFRQHSDAGLLMNDAVDDADAIVDLPPQYDTISNTPAARAQAQAAMARGGAPPVPDSSADSSGAHSSGSRPGINRDLLAALESGGTIGSDASSFARGRPLLDQLVGSEENEDEFWTSTR